MRRLGISALILLFATALAAQQTSFPKVKVRFSREKDHLLVEKDADLMLDDSARRLVVKSGDHPLDVRYDDVQKVTIELNTYGGKTGFGASFLGLMAGGVIFGGALATSIDKPLDNDHFVYLEYKKPDGSSASYLLSVDKDSAPQALKSLKAAFGERVALPTFGEKAEEIDKKQLKSIGTRFKMKGTARIQPSPELRPDKALVVVACPGTIGGMGQIRPDTGVRGSAGARGYAATILANDTLVGVTAPGTYTFFYLDPGEYFLGSLAHDFLGLRMKLEAGRDYYLTQTLYPKGFSMRTFLTRHSKELVMYEVAGALWSEWTVEEAAAKAEKN